MDVGHAVPAWRTTAEENEGYGEYHDLDD